MTRTETKQAHPVLWFSCSLVLLLGAYLAFQLHEGGASIREVEPEKMYPKITNDKHEDDSELMTEDGDRPYLVPRVEPYSDADRAELERIINQG